MDGATSSEITSRGYKSRADLEALTEFAARSTAARFPLESTWHPGDVVWQLKGAYDGPTPFRLWSDGGEPAVMSTFMGQDEFWLEAMPDAEALAAAVVTRGESLARRAGVATLKVRAQEADTARIVALEALGYRRSDELGVGFRFDLSGDLPELGLEPGFRARDSVGLDAEVRSACHRDAWSHLEHLGIHGESQFSAEMYRSLAGAPVYDPTLDVVIAAPDGRLVANAVAWADVVSGVGTFEPVGGSFAFRRRGFARAAVLEGVARLKARGMRWARVGTAHFNAPAIATYLSCGFVVIDRSAFWSKALSGSDR